MLTAWTKHLKDPKAKADFEDYLKRSKEIFNRLNDLIKEEESNLDRSELELKQFDSPSWPYQQAFKNGQRAALQKIMTLTTIEK